MCIRDRLTVEVRLKGAPAGRDVAQRYWTGQITTEPVEFEITAAPATQRTVKPAAAAPTSQSGIHSAPRLDDEGAVKELLDRLKEEMPKDWAVAAIERG